MGYGGKIEEQHQARELRSKAWTLADIAAELGVSKSSVSTWTREVEFEPNPRRTGRKRGPNKLQRKKADEIEQCRVDGIQWVGELSEREFLMAGLGLYAGDGAKTPGGVRFANSNPAMVILFCRWFRTFFDIDEERLRIQLYLHEDLDYATAVAFWSEAVDIPSTQFSKPYRAIANATRRKNRHVYGCCHVRYSSTPIHRQILGLMQALLLIPFETDLPG
jgi:transcriptional regulator with XRE-family HTH domain